MIPHSDILEQSVQSLNFVKTNTLKLVIYYVFAIITLGIGPVFIYWTPLFKFTCWTSYCSLKEAEYVIILNPSNTYELVQLDTVFVEEEYQICIKYRNVNFFFNAETHQFKKSLIFSFGVTKNSEIHKSKPVSSTQLEQKYKQFGKNTLETPLTPYKDLFLLEILSSYNFYQLFGCFIWLFREYALYASLIMIATIATIIV